MSEKLRESLSAIVDDEADEFELRRVLDELEKNPELKRSWDRYHLIGTVMRNEHSDRAVALRARVRRALDMEQMQGVKDADEPVVAPAAGGEARTPWLGRLTGLAVAASVALAVVLGLNTISETPGTTAPEVAAIIVEGGSIQSVGQSVGQGVGQSVTLSSVPQTTDEERMAAYIMHHTQQRAMNQANVAALVKWATYQRP